MNVLEKETDDRIKQVLDSGWYLLGEQDKAFEKNFADIAEQNTV